MQITARMTEREASCYQTPHKHAVSGAWMARKYYTAEQLGHIYTNAKM